MHTPVNRLFSTSTLSMYPRAAANISRVPELLNVAKITGDVDRDGVNRFELDTIETTLWTRSLLQAMKDDNKHLLLVGNKFTTPVTDPICIETQHSFTYDFSKPPTGEDECATIHIKVDKLNLTKIQVDRLVLLAGNTYSKELDLISMKSNKENATYEQNTNALFKTYTRLLDAAKVVNHINTQLIIYRPIQLY